MTRTESPGTSSSLGARCSWRRWITDVRLAFAALLLPVACSAATIAYYRFEEGSPDAPAVGVGSILDSVDNSADGTPSGDPVYRTDVFGSVVPQTGEANALALEFAGSQSVLFDSAFILHDLYADATLEFFVKMPVSANRSLFWTRDTQLPDAHRFNIGSRDTYDPEAGLFFDYREPNGTLRRLHPAGGFQLPADKWVHFAASRTVTRPSVHTYRFYVDGQLIHSHEDLNPNIPDGGLPWTISGRGPSEHNFTGLLDEIRFSDEALPPTRFLSTIPEPTTLLLGAIMLAGLMWYRRPS